MQIEHLYNHGRKNNYDKRSPNFLFYFDWPKYVDENLKHEIEFIIKSNESLAENEIKKRDCTIILEIQGRKQYS